MKRKTFFATFAVALLAFMASCGTTSKKNGSGTDLTADEIGAIGDSITTEKLEANYAEKDSLYFIDLSINFPTSGKEELRRSISGYIAKLMATLSPTYDPSDTAKFNAMVYSGDANDGKALLQHYLQLYRNGLKAFASEEASSTTGLFQNVEAYKEWKSDRAITYTVHYAAFQGGAHGTEQVFAQTFDKQTGKAVTVIDSTKTNEMQNILRQALKKQYFDVYGEQGEDYDLDNILFDKRVPLPATHLVMAADGVKFVYQQYEIAAYAYGRPQFTLPYSELKPYLTKEAAALIPTQDKGENK